VQQRKAKGKFKYKEEIEEGVWGRGKIKISWKVRIKKITGTRRRLKIVWVWRLKGKMRTMLNL
jgi:hypothetical protein